MPQIEVLYHIFAIYLLVHNLHGCQFTNVSLEEPCASIFHCEENKYFVDCTILFNCFGHTRGIYYLTLIDLSILLIVGSFKFKHAKPHAYLIIEILNLNVSITIILLA